MQLADLHPNLQTVTDELLSFTRTNAIVGLKPDEILICWFICALTGATFPDARDSLTGSSGDHALDAIHVDRESNQVLVVQGKLRQSAKKNEKRESVLDFASWAGLLRNVAEEDRLNHVLSNLAPVAKVKVDRARQALGDGFRLVMAYVTTGQVTEVIKSEADLLVREQCPDTQFSVYDNALTLSFFEEWKDDVVPVVPFATLRLEKLGNLSHTSGAGVQMQVAVVRGDQIVNLYSDFGQTLFERNIRGYQGETEINRDIMATITRDPESFLHLNNGVTIVCSDLRVVDEGAHRTATLRFPQIINGQQTTRTLSVAGAAASETLVLVRLIVLSGKSSNGDNRRRVVNKIVKATNSQNSIRLSDLYSNDPKQIALERKLRALGYQYLRKRATAQEAAKRTDSHLKPRIELAKLVQAIGSCLHDGFVGSIGPGRVFRPDEPYYDEFFGLELDVQLNAFWLQKLVLAAALRKESKQFAPAKWLVIHDTWQRLPLGVQEGSEFHRSLHRSEDNALEEAARTFLKLRFADMKRFHKASQRSAAPKVEIRPFFKGPTRSMLLAFEGGSLPDRTKTAFEKMLRTLRA